MIWQIYYTYVKSRKKLNIVYSINQCFMYLEYQRILYSQYMSVHYITNC